MEIDKWIAGYKVRAFNWIDGKNIYLNIKYYKSGSSLSQLPEVDKSFLIPKENAETVRERLESVVISLMERV